MAIFDKKKPVAKKKVVKKSTPKTAGKKREFKKHAQDDGRSFNVLTSPWLSEKAIIKMEAGVYTFKVPQGVTASDVLKAVALAYNVTPVKVNMVHLPAKVKSLRSKRGTGTRVRRHKAYVYLKKGETIQF